MSDTNALQHAAGRPVMCPTSFSGKNLRIYKRAGKTPVVDSYFGHSDRGTSDDFRIPLILGAPSLRGAAGGSTWVQRNGLI